MKLKKIKSLFTASLLTFSTLIFFTGCDNYEARQAKNFKHLNYVEYYAKKYELDPNLALAVLRAESSFEQNAHSIKDAYGYMQLTEIAAKEVGVNREDPVQNIEGGCKYLSKQIERFKDWDLALGAYNAGPSRIVKYNGVPPFSETQNFIEQVKNFYQIYREKRVFYTPSYYKSAD